MNAHEGARRGCWSASRECAESGRPGVAVKPALMARTGIPPSRSRGRPSRRRISSLQIAWAIGDRLVLPAADEEDQALGQPVHGGPIAPEGRDHEDGQGGEDDAGPGELIAARRFPAEEPRQAERRDDAREQAGAAIQRDAVRVLARVQVDPGPEQVEAAVEHADEERGDDQRAGEEAW